MKIDKLKQTLTELEGHLPCLETQNDAVSAANVGWHMQHSLLVLDHVLNALEASDPSVYRPRFTIAKTFVFLSGTIPRGRVKSPAAVRPSGTIEPDIMQQQVLRIRCQLDAISRLPANAFFKHPFFGDVNLRSAVVFMIIHTRHHLKIIRDIVN